MARRRREDSLSVAGTAFRFVPSDVRALLRLCNRLHRAPAGGTARKDSLLDGLCRLVGADAGTCVITQADEPGVPQSVVSISAWGATADFEPAVVRRRPAADKHPPQAGRSRGLAGRGKFAGLSPPGVRHRLESKVTLADSRVRSTITLFRGLGPRRAFSPRDLALVNLFHAEVAWLFEPDLPPASAAGPGLTPRQRQTLQFLLAGRSEKQIAAHLGLSPNTVHHYVKAIHRHFRVSSRSELLARWVR